MANTVPPSPAAGPRRRVVPWTLYASHELVAEYGGVSIRAYLLDPEARLRAEAAARQLWRERFGFEPFGDRARVETPAYVGAAAMGRAELVFPEDHNPMIVGHSLKDARDVYSLRRPESYLEHPAMAPFARQYRYLTERLGGRLRVGIGAGIEGPITTAKLLRGQDFFLDVVLRPDEAHRLVEYVAECNVAFVREVRQLQGLPVDGGTVGIADDFSGLLGPRHYREYALPAYQRHYGELAAERRTHHSELLRPDHLRLLVPRQGGGLGVSPKNPPFGAG